MAVFSSDLSHRDAQRIWHPCTQMQDHEEFPVIPLVKGEGVWLYDEAGNGYIDAISSWWVNLFGHAHPYISEKIAEQAKTLEHVIFAGFTHEPAVRLAERLCALSGMSRLFFADNGSSAVEVALKLSFHYWRNAGRERPLFVSLTGGYHGETMGALAVGDLGLYKAAYASLLLRTLQTPAPRDASEEAALEAARALEVLLAEHGPRVSALIFEPLVQCAGGMAMHHPRFLVEARRLCEAYDIHLILDEIAVGFGRTGTMFAYEQAGIKPDLLCLSKGLTGGYLPMSALLMTEEIYQAFYAPYDPVRSFLHSHSYTGNPIACAAANATLDLFEDEGWLQRNRTTAALMRQMLALVAELPKVHEVRQTGMIAAVELKELTDPRPARTMMRRALSEGVLLRPLGSILYLMPPYVITPAQLEHCALAIATVIEEVQ